MHSRPLRILLIKAPRGRYSYFREGSESLALGYLAAALRVRGHSVMIVDGQLEGLSVEQTLSRCTSEHYDLIGFTIADPSFIPSTFWLASAMREPDVHAHLTIGGYAPTFHFREVLQQCSALDSVVRYEGEESLCELAESIQLGRDWRNIPGLAYRNGNVVVCNEPRPLISDLNTLPFPVRDYVPFVKDQLPEFGVVSLSGSRGCYANCGFCSIRQFYREPGGPAYRLRSVKNVVDEIEVLVRTFGVDEFLLIDDIFTLPGEAGDERVADWHSELARRGLRVMLSISDRADHIRRPLYDALYEMGVRQIMIGVEATHPDILSYLNKKICLDDVRRAITVLNELGIDVTITYINFTPRTTIEILRENVDCLLSLNVNFLLGLLNRLQVYSGTPIAEEMIERGMVGGTFPDFCYRIPDDRVEVVYDVCRRCLSPFLEISYEIMKLERMFRVKSFRLESSAAGADLLAEGKELFKNTCRTIMEEGAEIFRSILDYAEKNDRLQDGFVEDVGSRTWQQYDLWHRELLMIRDHSPFFHDGDTLLLR